LGILPVFALSVVINGKSVVRGETLHEAWYAVSTQSYRLQAEQYQIQAADSTVRMAQAARSPIVTNSTSYVALNESPKTLVNLPIPGLGTMESPLVDKTFVTSTTAAIVPIYAGGKITSAIGAAQAQSSAVRAGHAVTVQDLKMETTEAYFLVLRVRQLHEVAVQAENSLISHERDAQNLLDNKLVTLNVLLAAQTARAAALQQVIHTQNGVALAEAAYNRLLNRPLDAPVFLEEIEIPEMISEQRTALALAQQATAHRMELAKLNAQSRALCEQSFMARGDRLPMVAAAGGFNYMENHHMTPNANFGGGVSFMWTPFDGGASRAKQRAAQQEAMAVNRIRDETRTLIELQVKSAELSEQESRERLAVAEKALVQAAENKRIVTRQFQEGLTNHTEVLDAQVLDTQAKSNYCNAVYDAILATFKLRRALGDLN